MQYNYFIFPKTAKAEINWKAFEELLQSLTNQTKPLELPNK